VLKDIRETPREEYAEELRKRWTSLLSYRYIGRNHGSMNTGPIDNTVTLRHDMRNAAGGILASVLSITCPGGAGRSDLQTVPNPVIQSCQILDDARDVKKIEVVDSILLRQGRNMDYGRAKIVDADNHSRVIAYIEGQSAAIGDVPPGLEKMPEDKIEVVDSPDLPPLWEIFGAWKRNDGHWVLPELRIELASPDAALHIGPQHVTLETAAIDAASDLVGTDLLQVQTYHAMHLARGKIGPFRVDASADNAGQGRVGVQLALVDEGNDDKLITSAAVVFRRAD